MRKIKTVLKHLTTFMIIAAMTVTALPYGVHAEETGDVTGAYSELDGTAADTGQEPALDPSSETVPYEEEEAEEPDDLPGEDEEEGQDESKERDLSDGRDDLQIEDPEDDLSDGPEDSPAEDALSDEPEDGFVEDAEDDGLMGSNENAVFSYACSGSAGDWHAECSINLNSDEKIDQVGFKLSAYDSAGKEISSTYMLCLPEAVLGHQLHLNYQVLKWRFTCSAKPSSIKLYVQDCSDSSLKGTYIFECRNVYPKTGKWNNSGDDGGTWSIDRASNATLTVSGIKDRCTCQVYGALIEEDGVDEDGSEGRFEAIKCTPWAGTGDIANVSKVKIEGNFADTTGFFGETGGAGVKSFDVSSLSMAEGSVLNIFKGCSSLETVDLSGLDTSPVADMSGLFDGCRKLKSLDLSGSDMSSLSADGNDPLKDFLKDCDALSFIKSPKNMADHAIDLPGGGWKMLRNGKVAEAQRIDGFLTAGTPFSKNDTDFASVVFAGMNDAYTVTIAGQSEPLGNGYVTGGAGRYAVSAGESLSFFVSPKEDCRSITGVKCGAALLKPSEDGKYTIANIRKDQTVSVTTRLKATGVSVSYDADILKVTLAGGKASGDEYLTDSRAVTVALSKTLGTVNLSGYDITASYALKGGGRKTEAEIKNMRFTIDEEYVTYAEASKKNIVVTISSEKRKVRIYPSEASDADAVIRNYGETGPEKDITAEKPYMAPYGEDAHINIEVPNNKRIKTVKAGTFILKPENLTKRTESGPIKEYTVYTVPALKKDTPITVVTEGAISFGFFGYGQLNGAIDDAIRHGFTVTSAGSWMENGVWKLPASASDYEFTYEVVTGGNRVFSFIQIIDQQFFPDSVKADISRRKLVYTGKARASDFKDKQIEVLIQSLPRKLRVRPGGIDSENISVTEKCVRASEPIKEEDGSLLYDLRDPFETVRVHAEADEKEGYKLGRNASLSAGGTISRIPLKNGSAELNGALYTASEIDGKEYGIVELEFDAEAVPSMTVTVGGEQSFYSDKAKLGCIRKSGNIKVDIYKGGRIGGDGTKVTFTPQSAGSYAVSGGSVVITPSANGKAVITAADPSSPKKDQKYEVSYTVLQPISGVRIKGETANRNDVNKSTLSQESGTEKTYGITLAADMNINDLRAENTSEDASVSIDPGEKKLSISTFSGKRICRPGTFDVLLYDHASDPDHEHPVKTVTVKVSEPALKAPAVTVESSSDIGMGLSLIKPAGMDHKGLYYVIKADACAGDDPKMKESECIDDIVASEGTTAVTLVLAKENKYGRGAEQAYDIEVYIVQTSDGEKPSQKNVIARGRGCKLLKQKTKKPNIYESRLTVTKMTTGFSQLQPGRILLGTVKFSKDTSFRKFDAYILDSEGKKFTDCIDISDGASIYLEAVDYRIAPGPAKLFVVPYLPEASHVVPAVVDLTVKPRPYTVKIENCKEKRLLVKEEGKPLTVKYNATVFDEDGNEIPHPPLRWSVDYGDLFNPSFDDDLYKEKLKGWLNIEDGVLTIDKDLVLPHPVCRISIFTNDNHNMYNDDNDIDVYITNGVPEIGRIEMGEPGPYGGIDSLSYDVDNLTVSAYDLVNKRLRAMPQSADVTFNMSRLTDVYAVRAEEPGLVIDETGIVTDIYKPGTYTLTAYPDKSYSAKITVTGDYENYHDYVATASRLDESYTELNKTGALNNDSVFLFRATVPCGSFPIPDRIRVLNGILGDVSVMRYSETGLPKNHFLYYQEIDYVLTAVITANQSGKDVQVLLGDETFTVRNPMGTGTLKVKSCPDIAADNTTSLKTELVFLSDKATSTSVKAMFRLNQAYLKAETEAEREGWLALQEALNGAVKKVDKDKKTVTLSSSFNNIPAGNYVFDAALYEQNDKPLTKPVKVTVKVKEEKPAAVPDLSGIRIENTEGSTFTIPFKKASFSSIDNIALTNNYDRGTFTDIARYFTASLSTRDGEPVIVLKRNGTPYSGTIGSGKKVNITGWLEYDITGLDGRTKEYMHGEKIIVTLEEPSP